MDHPQDVAILNPEVQAVRAELPAVQTQAYLNTGTCGPLPDRSVRAATAEVQRELTDGRSSPKYFERLHDISAEAREHFADLLGCSIQEIALTHNTTEGMNIAVMGLDWRPGDEVITSRYEHPGGLYPAYLLRQRYGVTVRMTDAGNPDRNPVDEIRAVLSSRTKAILLSHVSWSTGMVLPIREIAELAHSVGAYLICDAAQSGGMVATDVRALGVDAYACSGQKWLCGPDGTGALYVRESLLGEMRQTFMGYHSVRPGMTDFAGNFIPAEGAGRFEVATITPFALSALNTSLAWMRKDLGLKWIHNRITYLGKYCYDRLQSVQGVRMITPVDAMCGLVHFTIPGADVPALAAKLVERGITVRHTPFPLALRVSAGFYNTEDDIERLAVALESLIH